MNLTNEEQQFIRKLPKPYAGCALLQAAKDKSLREALVAELCDRDDIRAPGDIANHVMRVIKGLR